MIKSTILHELTVEFMDKKVLIGTFPNECPELKSITPQFVEFIKIAYPEAVIDLEPYKSKYDPKEVKGQYVTVEEMMPAHGMLVDIENEKYESNYAHKPKKESRVTIPLSAKQLKEMEARDKKAIKKTIGRPKKVTILPSAGEKLEPVILCKDLQRIKDVHHLSDETLLKLKQAVDSSLTVKDAVNKFTNKAVISQSLAEELVKQLMEDK